MNDITKFLFFDIETVGKYSTIDDLKKNDPKLYQLLYKKFLGKSEKEQKIDGKTEYELIEDTYQSMRSIIPEYGKIACITFGYVDDNNNWMSSTLSGDEEDILKKTQRIFQNALEKNMMPCGYNILVFDLPYINKKMIKYGIRIPYNILLFNKKPWEVKVLDLCEAWKTTGRYWSSLDEVTHELGLKSPKNELSGDKVHDTFWIENDIAKIIKYCEGDVKALKDIVEKMIISCGNI